MSKTLLCKLLQRKTYDILSKKYTIVFLFMGFVVLFVATLHFGETLMEWSKEKYAVVFSPYSDNILGKSYRNMLCQYVPIDVVYTWVNGSDPKFLKELYQAKEEYGFFGDHVNCSFSNCVKSHMLLVRPELPMSLTLGDLEEIDTKFQHLERTFVVSSQSQNKENITVLVFSNNENVKELLSMKNLHIDNQSYSLSAAYITDNWASQHTVLLDNTFLITQVPSGHSKQDILEKLPNNIRSFISNVHVHEEKNVVVLTLSHLDVLDSVLKLNNITFENKVATISPAHLVIQLPSEHEDISASRFTDNEELRYSLRSLEKHAPWVQHIYIITNGQIPCWLNLDNPRISIITHEDIFPNKSHLPTFSSPAIECHLHRIPNLSGKFLYLNDDVLFGKDVWPEDFFSHTKGQKVYLSWPVPNCAEGCPSSWIRDGYCDKPCNNSQCQWDGGDCTADNPMLPFQNIHHEPGITSYFNMRTANKAYCNSECADTWLADRYCDKACNVRDCGFDAGDCGLQNFDKLPQLILSTSDSHYYLPEGEYVGYFNMTSFLQSNYTVKEGFYEENPVIRSLAISIKYSIIGIVLYPNYNVTSLPITIKGELSSKPFEKIIHLHVSTTPLKLPDSDVKGSTEMPQTEDYFTFREFAEHIRYPKIQSLPLANTSLGEFENVNISASNLPEKLNIELQNFKKLLDKDLITYKAFVKKKAEIVANYVHSLNSAERDMLKLVTEAFEISQTNVASPSLSGISNDSAVHTPENKLKTISLSQTKVPSLVNHNFPNVLNNSFDIFQKQSDSKIILPRMLKSVPAPAQSLDNYFKNLNSLRSKKEVQAVLRPPSPSNPTQRHLLDTFGDSLRHVNKLYNEVFGYEARKVPSHIAHFVDKNVMSRLTQMFDSAFDITSSHKVRSSNDMQFAFSYYYYLMSEMESVEVKEIFNSFDVDKSGTWSDREIRTVLTRLYDLPLDFSNVAGFEQIIINCSAHSSTPPVTYNENYYDSKLPLVTQSLVLSCPPVSNMLLQHFGSRKRNFYEIMGEEEVAFKMIHNNLSRVLGQIDDLRKHPKKFVCLNDNMNHGTPEAEVIRAVIQDFYESLFPERSQFELSPEYRNRFLYVDDLKEWRRTRDIIRIVTYTSLGLLILFSAISFWKSEMRNGERYPRLRSLQNKHRNPQVV